MSQTTIVLRLKGDQGLDGHADARVAEVVEAAQIMGVADDIRAEAALSSLLPKDKVVAKRNRCQCGCVLVVVWY